MRKMKSLKEEIQENETADCKIIGLSVETRPDHINPDVLKRFRKYGIGLSVERTTITGNLSTL